MGRHSTPDDEDDLDVSPGDVPFDPGPETGRHARIEAELLEQPAVQVWAEDRPPETAAAEQRVTDPLQAAAPHRGATALKGDLALLRADGALRSRCVGVLVAPFLLYAVAAVVAGMTLHESCIWLWVPAVLGFGAVGALLDVAHRKAPTPLEVPAAAPSESTGPTQPIT